jgi:transposase-like protein
MKKQRFTEQKKQDCVAYALSHPELSIKAMAADLGVGYSSLDNWVRRAKLTGGAGAQRQLSPDQARIKQLEKEVAHLREVNDIIKKAHVYFVNHPSK